MNEINEKTIIEKAWKIFIKDKKELLGLDDANAFRVNEPTIIVVNIDTFDEETDWLPGMSYFDIGWKSIIMSMSDILVKGSKPLGCLISLGVPASITEKKIEELYNGMKKACNYVNANFWGGDTSFTERLHISVVSIGSTDKIISRNGARPGDHIFVSSTFGLTSLGYNYLFNGKNYIYTNIFLEYLYRPKLINLKLWNKIKNYATASIDSSDGLAISLNLLSEASKVKILLEKIPIDQLVYKNIEDPEKAIELALYHGGEEYSFIFTVSEENVRKVLEEAKKFKTTIYRIGKITEGRGVYLRKNRKEYKIFPRGWIHGSGWD